MLARARRCAASSGLDVALELADVERLPFDDDPFDTVTARCVLCSVAEPVGGLHELARVVRPDGTVLLTVLLLAHVRPRNPVLCCAVLGWLADVISPVTRRLFGPEGNRRTQNVEAAGLEIVDIRREGVWREIAARPRAWRPPAGPLVEPRVRRASPGHGSDSAEASS